MSYLYQYIKTDIAKLTDTPIITTYNKKRQILIQKTLNDNDYYIIAQSSHTTFSSLMSTDTFFYAFIFFLLILIFFIFCLCHRYSKRLTKQLMLPIDLLGEGAKRIQQGNLDVQLEYSIKDEFKPVFDSFNEMQTRLKHSILLSVEHEKDQQEMFAEISHDLKTPLTSIKGYVKGLEDGIACTEEKKAHYLKKIRTKTDDMSRLIDEILFYSRLERKKIIYHTEKIKIDSYLEEVLSSMQEDYQETNLKIQLISEAPLAIVNLDTLHFNRVLENIIGNSQKYSGKEHTNVTIYTKQEASHVTITLKDNGYGVDPDKLDTIFDTFYRGDVARNNPTNSSGLGLAISKHIIEQLSGTITAKNDTGLCIIIVLPTIT